MLLEAVPNLSIGPQDPALDTILDKLKSEQNPAWKLLDIHTDPDHNRTVLTLAGAPAPLQGALETLIDATLTNSTLEGHQGVHPRTGLIDVLPIIPLADARETDAHRTAHNLAHHLATKNVPSFFYARLSRHDPPVTLAKIRKAITWQEGSSKLPRTPDRGPPYTHPQAGATCIGVRDLLVAYNVLLDTTNLETGRSIASNVRALDGGIQGVQALAFSLPSRQRRIQVSTNITDTQNTAIQDIYAAISEQAHRKNVPVIEGELVGLAPKRVLNDSPERMGLETMPRSLEGHLQTHQFPTSAPIGDHPRP